MAIIKQKFKICKTMCSYECAIKLFVIIAKIINIF